MSIGYYFILYNFSPIYHVSYTVNIKIDMYNFHFVHDYITIK
jgi:hypothetical protein